MPESWKKETNWRASDDLIVVRVTYPDGRSDDMLAGAATLLLATRIFYRLGATDAEEGNTVDAALRHARDRVLRVLDGGSTTLDGINVHLPPPHAD